MKLLLAEDDPQVRAELKEILEEENYEVVTAADGIEAFEKFRADKAIELLLLDIRMPRCTGLQTLEAIRKSEDLSQRIFEAIFITGNNDNDSIVTALKLNAFAFQFKPIQVEALLNEIEDAKDTVNIRRYRKFQQETLTAQAEASASQISRLTSELEEGFGSAVELLAVSAEHYISGIELHVLRVGEMAACLGERLEMTKAECQALRLAAMLHDIGKFEGPSDIYNASRTLTAEEFEQTKKHTLTGRDFLARSKDPIFQLASRIAEQHHENYDGTGYPQGLSGDDICMEASIVHAVDVYDNLRAPRPYRDALPHHQALDIIVNGDKKSSPDHFHPRVLQAVLSKHRDIESIYERYRPPVATA